MRTVLLVLSCFLASCLLRTAVPLLPLCGDGLQDLPQEECDDGNVQNGDGCSAQCLLEEVVASCGNNVLDTGEACDGKSFGTQTCQTQGFAGGSLRCSSTCELDTGFCQNEEACGNGSDDNGNGLIDCADPVCASDPSCPGCGNGVLEGNELCDGNNLGGLSCQGLGFASGTLSCNADCSLNDSQCTNNNNPVCGNGVLEVGETCDGQDFGGQSCQGLGFVGGALSCNADCSLNTIQCTNNNNPVCGNGVREGNEACDSADLAGQNCQSQGFAGGGTLACNNDCTFNVGQCLVTVEVCGNGVREGAENCDGVDLGGQSCQTLDFQGGTLSCNGDCTFNTNTCTQPVCGNGVQEAGEDCDFFDFGGQTCQSLGFTGGNLFCRFDCSFGLNNCTTNIPENCTNGVDDNNNGQIDCQEFQQCGQACQDICNAPQGLQVPSTVTGNNQGHADSRDSSCIQQNGSDIGYQVTVPSSGLLRITVTSQQADLGISARGTCNSFQSELGCTNQVELGTEILELQVTAGQSLTIIVDGVRGTPPPSSGPFTLEIELL